MFAVIVIRYYLFKFLLSLRPGLYKKCVLINGWLVVLGLLAISDSISVYIGPPPRQREKEERNDR